MTLCHISVKRNDFGNNNRNKIIIMDSTVAKIGIQTIMTAKDLKVGSVIETKINISPDRMDVTVKTTIDRVSETYVWFKYMSLQRIARTTIDKYPTLYKIISL